MPTARLAVFQCMRAAFGLRCAGRAAAICFRVILNFLALPFARSIRTLLRSGNRQERAIGLLHQNRTETDNCPIVGPRESSDTRFDEAITLASHTFIGAGNHGHARSFQ